MKSFNIVCFCLFSLLISDSLKATEGVLDTSFHAPNGYILWDGGKGYDRARDVALQQDGKIVVVGYLTNGSGDDLLVLRYDPNGLLDPSFGTKGSVIYDSGLGNDVGLAVATQSDGCILVAGRHSTGVDDDILVMRLKEDGIPDPNFGSDGVVSYHGGWGHDGAIDLIVQGDGSIVIAGYSHNGINNDLLILRLTAEGLLDKAFNTDGAFRFDGGEGHDFGLRLAQQLDLRIVVAGQSYNGSDYDILVARLESSGIFDRTFGNNGILYLGDNAYDRGYGVGLDSQGRILVTGLMTQPDAESTDYDIALFRLDPNGILDPNFGENGVALYDGGNREECYDMVVQCDDSVLVAGHSGYSKIGSSDWSLVVLKYDPDGLLDPTFGTQGVYSYDPTADTEWGYGLALQPAGKIVVVGQAHNGSDDDAIVLRLENHPCDVNEPNEPNLPAG